MRKFAVLINLDFKVCKNSFCVYYKLIGNIRTIICKTNEEESFKVKEALSTKFSIKDLGRVKSLLGIRNR